MHCFLPRGLRLGKLVNGNWEVKSIINIYKILIIVASVLFINSTSYSHHSNAPHYDKTKPLTIFGFVEEFEFVNPHAFVHIKSIRNGESVIFSCEMLPSNTLMKQGWTKNTFPTNRQVKVNAIAARRNPLGCWFESAETMDGIKIEPRGVVVEFDSGAFNYDKPVFINNVPNFKGPWKRSPLLGFRSLASPDANTPEHDPSGGSSPKPGSDILTEEGLKAGNEHNAPLDDPALQCSGASIRRVWGNPFSATDIIQTSDFIYLSHEYMDVKRIIKLTKEHDDGYQNQLYGHSIGWYEDDTLVIDTIGSGSGVLLPYPGVLHSDQLHFVEKIKLNDDGLGFTLTWLAEDPIYYKKSFSGIMHFEPSAYDVQAWDCTFEKANR